MRWMLTVLLLPLMLGASYLEEFRWQKNQTFLQFLESMDIPSAVYYDLDNEDQQLTEEIISGVHCQMLKEDDGSLVQILIPLNDELQVQIRKESPIKYDVGFVPIVSQTRQESFALEIHKSPYQDILEATGSKKLAQIFINGFKNSLNFRRDIRKGDRLVMVYDQKYRLGKPFSMPELKVAMVETRGKQNFIYRHTDGRYYDENGKQVEGFLLNRPVPGARVSSPFTKRRWHPVLRKYRAHLGVDYAAPTGTPIYAAGSGKVISASYSRGYGNVVKVRHEGGYMTLYAHMHKFRRGIKSGKYVKKGQVLGYVGSTGLSTGPHLHFGLYKNNRAINPASVIRITTKKLSGKSKQAFAELKESYNALVASSLQTNDAAEQFADFEYVYYLDDGSVALLEEENKRVN